MIEKSIPQPTSENKKHSNPLREENEIMLNEIEKQQKQLGEGHLRLSKLSTSSANLYLELSKKNPSKSNICLALSEKYSEKSEKYLELSKNFLELSKNTTELYEITSQINKLHGQLEDS